MSMHLPGTKCHTLLHTHSPCASLPIDTVTPHALLMLRNCFLDFAVEH